MQDSYPLKETIRDGIMDMVSRELDRAYEKHGAEQWGRHEFYAILKEEVDELWDAIKADEPDDRVEDEIIDTMAMCVRYLETGDRYRHPAPKGKQGAPSK